MKGLKKQRIEAQKLKLAYEAVFDGSPQADLVLRDIFSSCGVFNGGYDPDPHHRDFRAGERNAGLRIATMCELTADQILELAREGEPEVYGNDYQETYE